MKKIYAFVVLTFLCTFRILAQTGELQGRAYDQSTKEGIPFANVVLEQNGAQKGYGQTDDNGNYTIKPIVPGTYDVKISYLGYRPKVFTGLIVNADRITFQDIPMESSVSTLPDVVVTTQKLVEPDKTTTGNTLTKDEIGHLATRDTRNYASLTAGVFQRDDKDALNIGGARDYSTKYYVDGIPMRGSLVLPASSIEQLTVLTGGIPARYGDATGGIINITTRGPSEKFAGGAEVVTSQFLDAYGYDLANVNLSGPIYTKNKGTDSAVSKIGFFITGEYEHNKDPDPSAVGIYRVKDDVLQNLQTNPLTASPAGSGYVPTSSFVTADDLEKIKYKQNIASNSYRFSGKLDFLLNKYITFTLGGDFNLERYHAYDFNNQMFAPGGNRYFSDNTYRGFLRFTQRFGSGFATDTKSASVFQNAYYSIQADYSKFQRTFGDENYGTNAFDYGYVGKFTTYRQPNYVFGTDTTDNLTGWLFTGYKDTLVKFEPGTANPLLSNYTTQYYDLSGPDPVNHYSSLTDIINGGGLINGSTPPSVYSLWNNTGYPVVSYGKANNDQIRLSLNASVDIVNTAKGEKGRHALEFGFEYEQRVERDYFVRPFVSQGIWGLARQLANAQISQLDLSNPIPVYDNMGVYLDTVNYNFKYVASDQAFFDKSLRQALGLPIDGKDIIDVDAIDPSKLSLGMFSPAELFNNGDYLVFYYGYDYLGNRLKKQPSIDDFFNQKDANGNNTYNSQAYSPIYSSAYIQDKFNFRDLIFNIGLRVDRFDANQKVLKDPYSLYPVRTAAEVTQFGPHPATIGDNYYVYVDDISQPTKIVGYRNGGTWYNAQGTEIPDPGTIAKLTSTGGITPYLENPDNQTLSSESFEDYTPQITVMPRIAFSFPISDEALFFAHYDVLSQRPQGTYGLTPSGNANIATPIQYLYIRQLNTDYVLANPALKPERTIDYQVGFKQALGTTSAITIAGTYRELKDMVQVEKVAFAYPVEYSTYGNSDFGTVKSLQLTYELRRVKNVKIDANYTLQFADGTGSNVTSGLNLIGSGQPNLRTIIPFSYDQRHTMTLAVDYRYGEGRSYNGPVIGKNNSPILANTGLNVIFRAGSGTPYSRQTTATPEVLSGVQTNSSIAGSVNGSRLPWTFKVDARLDKNFKLSANTTHPLYFDVYILVQNLLNTLNIISVYAYTGNPNDDGYLESPNGQQTTASELSPSSFTTLYQIRVNNPDNYSQPRRIHLGVEFNF